MKIFKVPRGTSDILPDAVILWEELESKARKICKSYGYREIRTPVYEDINLFKRSLGQTSDIVNKQLLTVGAIHEICPTRQQETSVGNEPVLENDYALRPEGTAPIVRSYLENSFDKKEPLSKFFYIGPMFRGERPQKGRLRQFHQIGVEAMGPNSISAFLDAEIIALAIHLLKDFNVRNPKLKINSLGSKEDKADISKWLRKEFAKHKKDLCEDCQNRFERNVFRVLDCKNEKCRKAVDSVIGQDKALSLSKNSRDYFEYVQKILQGIGIDYEISPHLVRGLDYYTHTVFEITAEGLGSQDAVGAGGRYGGLVPELGGSENVGGIGFALGIERILLSVDLPRDIDNSDSFVIAMKEEYQQNAFLLVQRLRKEGIGSDMSYGNYSFKWQLNHANKMNIHYVLILGEDEIKNNTVALKDMQTGTQETVGIKDIVEVFKNKLK